MKNLKQCLAFGKIAFTYADGISQTLFDELVLKNPANVWKIDKEQLFYYFMFTQNFMKIEILGKGQVNIMIQPDKVRAEAKKKENENFKFRTYLKCHADEDELDSQFLRLHKELFADYDCSKCRNCCKMYKGSIPTEDIDRDAQYLGITPEQFINAFLEKDEYEMNYQTKHKPCDFLQEDGSCKLGDCKPDSCKKYPYTDQPERLSSLLSVLDVIEICPVALEIYERLKKEYGFRVRR